MQKKTEEECHYSFFCFSLQSISLLRLVLQHLRLPVWFP